MTDQGEAIKVTQEDRLRKSSELLPALQTWFFNDVGETQRRQLLNWCGFPGVEANGYELQLRLLHEIVARIAAEQKPREAAPSPDAEARAREVLQSIALDRVLMPKHARLEGVPVVSVQDAIAAMLHFARTEAEDGR